MYQEVQKIIDESAHIVVLQADNPDGDSLASALALEAILSEQGKQVTMVCGVDMPAHLKYLSGWDRVVRDLPQNFDITIVVDCSSPTLFDVVGSNQAHDISWIKTKPVIVLDHHESSPGLDWANVEIIEPVAATGELIYKIAKQLDWPLPNDSVMFIGASILSDTLGLSTDATSPETFRTMAELVERGLNITELDEMRREESRKDFDLIAYKGRLLERVMLEADGKLASVAIPWAEIEEYSPRYNPTILALDDMRSIRGVALTVGYKVYPDGKITAKLRANYGYPIARDLAEHFGGGGHPYAAGFKTSEFSDLATLRQEVNKITKELLNENL